MPRIKIEMPDKFIFQTELPLRITDINYGGHLGNDSLLSIIHEARVQFLINTGFPEKNTDGKGIIMIDAAVQYKSEIFYGDVLIIEIAAADFTGTGCDIIYRITNKKTKKEVAIAKTGIVFFDYRNRRMERVPSEFIKKIREFD